MSKTQSVISLDSISTTRKKQDSVISRLFKTTHCGGKPVIKTDEIGHYIFCGKQRSGKTVSMIWFAERLIKKYEKRGKKVILWSNMDIGQPINKYTLSKTIESIEYDPKIIHIFMVDEIHGYFPKDCNDKDTKLEIDVLTRDFSQVAKKQIYILSTAQVYGRINKNLREQCLYMVQCRRSRITNRVVNDFIDGDDIICDELGRWAGIAKHIYVHGLPKSRFDTHKMILQ